MENLSCEHLLKCQMWRKRELRRDGRRSRKIESKADRRGSYIAESCQTVFLPDRILITAVCPNFIINIFRDFLLLCSLPPQPCCWSNPKRETSVTASMGWGVRDFQVLNVHWIRMQHPGVTWCIGFVTSLRLKEMQAAPWDFIAFQRPKIRG